VKSKGLVKATGKTVIGWSPIEDWEYSPYHRNVLRLRAEQAHHCGCFAWHEATIWL